MTTVLLDRDANETVIVAGLKEHGLTERQIVAGLKYYRKMLSRFEKYQLSPGKAVKPIVRNIENMKAGYSA